MILNASWRCPRRLLSLSFRFVLHTFTSRTHHHRPRFRLSHQQGNKSDAPKIAEKPCSTTPPLLPLNGVQTTSIQYRAYHLPLILL
ncbi:hypothetical protein F5148DRAFT_1178235, partial [Russula earlei]